MIPRMSQRSFVGRSTARVIAALASALIILPSTGFGQVVGAAHFELSKRVYLLGEPVFCDYLIRNAGTATFVFPHRAPTRTLTRGLGSEPQFVLTNLAGRRLPDPAPEPCGGRQGTVIYGTTTLPPGQTNIERWVLNQWGRIQRPGVYHVHAQRHLPLFAFDPTSQNLGSDPSGYAEAMNDLSFKVIAGNEAELKKVYAPWLEILNHPSDPGFADAVIAITTVPHPFLEPQLVELLGRRSDKYPWVREWALQGLARLDTRSSWNAILRLALGGNSNHEGNKNLDLRSSAILMLAEKGEPRFLPGLLRLLKSGPNSLQQDVLRALGFFHDGRANLALFDHLYAGSSDIRTNAILGLKNLNARDSFPALLAMLNDPQEEVRQVANFALQGLTGQHFQLPDNASRSQIKHTEKEWENWWQAHNATFTPVPLASCHDW